MVFPNVPVTRLNSPTLLVLKANWEAQTYFSPGRRDQGHLFITSLKPLLVSAEPMDAEAALKWTNLQMGESSQPGPRGFQDAVEGEGCWYRFVIMEFWELTIWPSRNPSIETDCLHDLALSTLLWKLPLSGSVLA